MSKFVKSLTDHINDI